MIISSIHELPASQPIRDLGLILVNVRKLSNLLSTAYFISVVFQMRFDSCRKPPGGFSGYCVSAESHSTTCVLSVKGSTRESP